MTRHPRAGRSRCGSVQAARPERGQARMAGRRGEFPAVSGSGRAKEEERIGDPVSRVAKRWHPRASYPSGIGNSPSGIHSLAASRRMWDNPEGYSKLNIE